MLSEAEVREDPGTSVSLGASTSRKMIITMPRSASGSSVVWTVRLTVRVTPASPILIPLTETVSFCRQRLLEGADGLRAPQKQNAAGT